MISRQSSCFHVTCENLHMYTNVLAELGTESEINDPIRLSDFYGLESLSVEFIYMKEVMDMDRAHTSEECNNEGGGGGKRGRREVRGG